MPTLQSLLPCIFMHGIRYQLFKLEQVKNVNILLLNVLLENLDQLFAD
jgi:hypothetical protein